MRLHSAKVPQIAAEMVSALLSGGDVESESPKEVGLDIASVLNQYIRDEQEVSEQAKVASFIDSFVHAKTSLPPEENDHRTLTTPVKTSTPRLRKPKGNSPTPTKS